MFVSSAAASVFSEFVYFNMKSQKPLTKTEVSHVHLLSKHRYLGFINIVFVPQHKNESYRDQCIDPISVASEEEYRKSSSFSPCFF